MHTGTPDRYRINESTGINLYTAQVKCLLTLTEERIYHPIYQLPASIEDRDGTYSTPTNQTKEWEPLSIFWVGKPTHT